MREGKTQNVYKRGGTKESYERGEKGFSLREGNTKNVDEGGDKKGMSNDSSDT